MESYAVMVNSTGSVAVTSVVPCAGAVVTTGLPLIRRMQRTVPLTGVAGEAVSYRTVTV
jgi:hypothetical protein